MVLTDVILTSHSQDLNTLLTTWGPTYIQMQSRCVESKQKKTSTIVMNYLVSFGNDQSLCGAGENSTFLWISGSQRWEQKDISSIRPVSDVDVRTFV